MGNGDAPVPGAAPAPHWWRSVSGVVMCGFLLVAGFYLLTEQTAHLWGVLPFLLLLSCPLMHLFHHHGHGKHAAGPPPVPGTRAVPLLPGTGIGLSPLAQWVVIPVLAFIVARPRPTSWGLDLTTMGMTTSVSTPDHLARSQRRTS